MSPTNRGSKGDPAQVTTDLSEVSVMHFQAAARGYRDSFIASIRKGYAANKENLRASFTHERADLLQKQIHEREMLVARQGQELTGLSQRYAGIVADMATKEKCEVSRTLEQFEQDPFQAIMQHEEIAGKVKVKEDKSAISPAGGTEVKTNPLGASSESFLPVSTPKFLNSNGPSNWTPLSNKPGPTGWSGAEVKQQQQFRAPAIIASGGSLSLQPAASARSELDANGLNGAPRPATIARVESIPSIPSVLLTAQQSSFIGNKLAQLSQEPLGEISSERMNLLLQCRPKSIHDLEKKFLAGAYNSAEMFLRDLDLFIDSLRSLIGDHHVLSRMGRMLQSEFRQALMPASSQGGPESSAPIKGFTRMTERIPDRRCKGRGTKKAPVELE